MPTLFSKDTTGFKFLFTPLNDSRWLYSYIIETNTQEGRVIHGLCYLKPPSCSLLDLLPGTSYGIVLRACIYPSPNVRSCSSTGEPIIETTKPNVIRKILFEILLRQLMKSLRQNHHPQAHIFFVLR